MPVYCGKTAAGLRALNGMALGNYKLQACSKKLWSHSLTIFNHWGWKSLKYLPKVERLEPERSSGNEKDTHLPSMLNLQDWQGGITRDSPGSCSEQLGKYLGVAEVAASANCFRLVLGGPCFQFQHPETKFIMI